MGREKPESEDEVEQQQPADPALDPVVEDGDPEGDEIADEDEVVDEDDETK
jgi:hypothetical protein